MVAVVAFDGVVLGDLATPCEIFRAVRDSSGQSPYEVRVCSSRRNVRSEYLTIKVPWRLSLLERANTVIVPGIDSIDRPVPEAVLRVLREAAARRVRIASICSGAFVLARTGVLNGLKATTHWMVARELACRYPEIDVNPDVLYVDNGRLLTSAGAAAGFDLCLHLVRRDCGGEIAAQAARAAVMPLERAGGQAQFIVHNTPLIKDKAGIGPLLIWIEQNLRCELSLPALARRAAMSTRTLSRRFRDEVGATPAEWVGLARVRHAQQLLETTNLSVEEVATETGFRSASVLREHFGEVVGTAPLAYRRAFASDAATR
jgi:transcriptional regulator GlxA family with amidase domain